MADGPRAIRPLGEIRLGEDDRSSRTQASNPRRVPARDVVRQGETTRRRRHAIPRFDVVLYDDGQAVQRAARLSGFALGIQHARFRQCIGIERDDRVETRPRVIEASDAVQVSVHERDAGELAFGETIEQLGGGHLYDEVICDRSLQPTQLEARTARESR